MAGPTVIPGSASQSKRQRVVDDSDEESNDVNTAMEIVPANAAEGAIVPVDVVVLASKQPSDIVGFSPDLLRLYYGRLFPYASVFKWLSYGNDRSFPSSDAGYFGRREFSFTLENDIYVRYQSFKDCAEMEGAIKGKNPHKIDIGAVYNVDPAKRQAYQSAGSERAFSPVERELVFDVDISDYNEVRTCCGENDICTKCWTLMAVAIKVVDAAMREDFGFEHLLWVFSGRRGVHCWVCDPRARRLTNEQRSSVAEYLRVYKGEGGISGKQVHLGMGTFFHPALSRAHGILESAFEGSGGEEGEGLLSSQHLLTYPDSLSAILGMLPDEGVRASLESRWHNKSRPQEDKERWRELKKAVEVSWKASKNYALQRWIHEVMFIHAYPRLDLEVSKTMNHLLKAPFCIHPKTGKVCVPLDVATCHDFDPQNVPTLSQLLNELNAAGTFSAAVPDVDRTSLKEPLDRFHTSFLNPLLKACRADLDNRYQKKLKAKAAGSFDF